MNVFYDKVHDNKLVVFALFFCYLFQNPYKCFDRNLLEVSHIPKSREDIRF